MTGLKMQKAGETKPFHTYIKENYTHTGKGYLNHQALYSVIIKDSILFRFPYVERIF
jgi:hypothetical protein